MNKASRDRLRERWNLLVGYTLHGSGPELEILFEIARCLPTFLDRIDRLEKALSRYGGHEQDCDKRATWDLPKMLPCSCGLDAVIEDKA